MRELYFDSAATTKPCQAAIEAANRAFDEYGNPSSLHYMGIKAKRMQDHAREQVAKAMGCDPDRVFFTAGGTESNNLALLGAAYAKQRHSRVIVITDSEHSSVENTAKRLENEGFEIVRVSTTNGNLNEEELRRVLDRKVGVVSIMHANNETGALYDLELVRSVINSADCGALFHTDDVQGFLKSGTEGRSRRVTRICDLVSVSAHKVHGLKGCGALYIKKGLSLSPLINGGGHEKGMRSGTENVPAIAAFGAACGDWVSDTNRIEYIEGLRKYAVQQITKGLMDKVSFHEPKSRISSILNLSLPGVKSEVALNYLSGMGVYVSAGSACAGTKRENRVLEAFGLDRGEIESVLRISFCHYNTKEEVSELVDALEGATKLTERL